MSEALKQVSISEAIRLKEACGEVVTQFRKKRGVVSDEVHMEEIVFDRKHVQEVDLLDPPIRQYFDALNSLKKPRIQWRNPNPSLRLLVDKGSGSIWLGMVAAEVGPFGLMVTAYTHEIFNGNRVQIEILPLHWEQLDRPLVGKLQGAYDRLKKYVENVGPVSVFGQLLNLAQTAR